MYGFSLSDSGCCLVHCASGVSRSVTICVAYLMIHGHCASVDESLELIRRQRPNANPNVGFRYQLTLLQKHDCDVTEASRAWADKHKSSGGFLMDVIELRNYGNEKHAEVKSNQINN